MTVDEEITVIGFVAEPTRREHQARPVRIADTPSPIRPCGSGGCSKEASGARFVASPWDVW
jgi:hypothetical protein